MKRQIGGLMIILLAFGAIVYGQGFGTIVGYRDGSS